MYKFIVPLVLTAALLTACDPAIKDAPKISEIEAGADADADADANSKMASVDPQIEALITQALNDDTAYKVTESLTTEIGARMGGSPAEARARDWGVDKLTELGFENVRIETFEIDGWERGIETASIVSPYAQNLYITALGNSIATPSGGITAPVAYFPTFEDLEAAPEDGLEGKIVYISGRMKKAPDGAGYGPANKKRQMGAKEGAKRGALAVLIRSVGTDSHRFPHTGNMRYAVDTPKIPIAAMSGPDADQMDRILESGKDVVVKMEIGAKAVGKLTSGNVIGEIVGTEKPDEIVLIGGHIDSWDLGTGAVDDGAGIGITVGAAKVLIDSGLKPKRTIRVVMFGSEEIGLLGGFAYAEKYAETLGNHVMASESDFGAGPVYEVRPGNTPEMKVFAKELHEQISGLDVALSDVESGGGPDIIPLNAKGVPSVRLQQNGYDYFDLHHTPDDTFDKIDPKDMAQNVAAYAALIWMASESDALTRVEAE